MQCTHSGNIVGVAVVVVIVAAVDIIFSCLRPMTMES